MTIELTCGCTIYKIIERKLPKKCSILKYRSVVEREDAKKIGKFWSKIVKRDLPKHHKFSYCIIENNQMMLKNLQNISKSRYIKISIKHTLYDLHKTLYKVTLIPAHLICPHSYLLQMKLIFNILDIY